MRTRSGSGFGRTRSCRTRSAIRRRGRSAWPASSRDLRRHGLQRPQGSRSDTCATTCCGTRRGSATTPSTALRDHSPMRLGHLNPRCRAVLRSRCTSRAPASRRHRRFTSATTTSASAQVRRAQRFNSRSDERLDVALLTLFAWARRERQDPRGRPARRCGIGASSWASRCAEAVAVRAALRGTGIGPQDVVLIPSCPTS